MADCRGRKAGEQSLVISVACCYGGSAASQEPRISVQSTASHLVGTQQMPVDGTGYSFTLVGTQYGSVFQPGSVPIRDSPGGPGACWAVSLLPSQRCSPPSPGSGRYECPRSLCCPIHSLTEGLKASSAGEALHEPVGPCHFCLPALVFLFAFFASVEEISLILSGASETKTNNFCSSLSIALKF